MEISCPACGKTNDLLATTSCSRCGCDLGPLARIVAGALWHLQAATGELRAGDWDAAFEHAQRSWSLRHSPRAARLAWLAAMTLGETRDALSWHRRAQGSGRR